jgi:hypothetical protein
MIGDGGERVKEHQGRIGTRHLAGHGRTEPKTKVFQLGGKAIILDGSTTPFTRFSGCQVLLQKQTYVPGGGIGTPKNAADVGARIGGNKRANDGNGGIRSRSLVVNQLRADTELVGPVEVLLRPNDTGDVRRAGQRARRRTDTRAQSLPSFVPE